MCIPMVEHLNANMTHPRTAIGITVESSSAATTSSSSSSSSSSRNNKDNTRKRRILNLLQHIPTFTFRFLRLVTFVLCLLPAFITFAYHYVMCDRQVIYYGTDPNGQVTFGDIFSSTTIFSKRRYLDIYGSHMTTTSTMMMTTTKKKKPVVIFLTGGAWIIGYRMWGTLLARALVPFGILVVIPDYRNFPCVDIAGMVNDVDAAIQWVFDHVEEYGGDANNVILVGQSAGAHIGEVIVAKKVLDWVRTERKQHQPPHEGVNNHSLSLELMEMNQLKSTYSPQQIRGFISTSCPHNLVDMRRVFHKHGFNAHVQWSIFGGLGEGANNINSDDGEGINDNVVPPITRRYSLGFLEGLAPGVFERWSPYHLIMQCHTEYMSLPPRPSRRTTRTTLRRNNECRPALKDIFPKLCIIHGTADETVPVSEAIEFISLLNQLHIPTETRMYHGWSHTDPILEAPMCGDHSYHRDIFELVKLWTIDDNGDVYSDDSNLIEKEMNGIHNSRRKQRGVDIATFDERHPLLRSICPTILVSIARYCNPF